MIKDKVVIVTGASSGIGYATSIALARAGAKVAIGARRSEKLDKLKEEITKENKDSQVISKILDVTKKENCNEFVKYVVDTWGTVDVLINNAGLMPLSFFKNLKIDEWDKMIDVNIRGVLYCTAAVIPHLLNKKSGHIINISSVAGRIVFPAGSVYCATKHAITAFSEGLRQEFSSRSNIRVTCIEPGVVATELTDTITDESLTKFVESTKQMEALNAEDIANTILFALESPNHANINEILIRPTAQDR